MDSLIETFHIDLKLLIAQSINFAIVISVLYFFILKPVIKTMNDRTKKIEKSMIDAQKIEDRIKKTDDEYKKRISQAKKNAVEIINQAQTVAGEKREQMLTKAKEEIGQIINEEKIQIQQEKAKTLKEIKAEVADLVVATTEKVLEKKLDPKTDRDIIKKAVKK